MKKITKPISLILQIALLGLAIVFVGAWVLGKQGIINPIFPFVVLSGSMEPAVPTGSVVFVSPKPFGYAVGDIITFNRGGKDYTTHRVSGLVDESGQIAYQTQGDANNAPDPQTVAKKDIKGAVILTVPYIGYAVSQTKTPYGFILLIIIPSTIIIYEELKSLKNETVKIYKGRKTVKKSKSGGGGSRTGHNPAPLNVNLVRTYKSINILNAQPAKSTPIKVPSNLTPQSVAGAMSYLHADKINSLPHPVTNLPRPVPIAVPPPPPVKPRYNAPAPPTSPVLAVTSICRAGRRACLCFCP